MDPVGKRYENKGKNDHANKNNDTPRLEFCVSRVALFAETVIKKKRKKKGKERKNEEGEEQRD